MIRLVQWCTIPIPEKESTAGKNLKYHAELWCHLVDILELFLAIFYYGTQWGTFLTGINLKIKNHMILDICLENIFAKFGYSWSRIKKIKPSQYFTYKTYIKLW